ncbi:MAG: DUF3048 domain-containing protein [Lachnospiraceae bacterium]|nr:DUF3048 domain-containing protein [Lachnospiraceae bacterium]
MKRKVLCTIVVALCTLSLVACNKKEEPTVDYVQPEIETVDKTEPEVTEAVVEEVHLEDELPAGMYFSELTHLPIDESLKDQRPIAAMVDNEKTALPHFGMNEADIVYEIMNSTQNDRITRFMVLMKDWGSIEQLGSIRSTRPTNILLAAEYNAVLCHDGGPFYIDAYFSKEIFKDHFSGIFSRVDNGKAREFTEYIMPGDLDKAFKNSGFSQTYTSYYPGEHFNFAAKVDPITLEKDENAIKATFIDLPFKHNGSELKYNEEDMKYYYSEYGDPHNDGKTGEQLCFDNVIIQNCTFSQLDDHGYLIYNVIDSGKAGYYCTHGKAIPITWAKGGEDNSITRFYDGQTGEEIRINTGKTYITIIPSDNWDQLVIE